MLLTMENLFYSTWAGLRQLLECWRRFTSRENAYFVSGIVRMRDNGLLCAAFRRSKRLVTQR